MSLRLSGTPPYSMYRLPASGAALSAEDLRAFAGSDRPARGGAGGDRPGFAERPGRGIQCPGTGEGDPGPGTTTGTAGQAQPVSVQPGTGSPLSTGSCRAASPGECHEPPGAVGSGLSDRKSTR